MSRRYNYRYIRCPSCSHSFRIILRRRTSSAAPEDTKKAQLTDEHPNKSWSKWHEFQRQNSDLEEDLRRIAAERGATMSHRRHIRCPSCGKQFRVVLRRRHEYAPLNKEEEDAWIEFRRQNSTLKAQLRSIAAERGVTDVAWDEIQDQNPDLEEDLRSIMKEWGAA